VDDIRLIRKEVDEVVDCCRDGPGAVTGVISAGESIFGDVADALLETKRLDMVDRHPAFAGGLGASCPVVDVDREAWAEVMGVGVVEVAGEAPNPREKNPPFLGSSFAGGVTTGSGSAAMISTGGGAGERE
jgi:hypothetical protein